MKISTVLKFAQIALIAFAFIFATSYTPSDVQAAGKKPSFAGKPAENWEKAAAAKKPNNTAKTK